VHLPLQLFESIFAGEATGLGTIAGLSAIHGTRRASITMNNRSSLMPFESPAVKLRDQFLTFTAKFLCLSGIVTLQSFLDPLVNRVRVNLQIRIGVKAVVLRSRSRRGGRGGAGGGPGGCGIR
jgi:hypothetical protein